MSDADTGMRPVPEDEQTPEVSDEEPDEPVYDDPDDEHPEETGGTP